MPDFETFRRPTLRPSGEPTVIIGVRGQLRLNKAAMDTLSAAKVELLYDRDARIVGLRPAQSGDAFTVHALRDGGGGQINAAAFLNHYGIVYEARAFRYRATADDGVLCVDLEGPRVATTSNRRSDTITS